MYTGNCVYYYWEGKKDRFFRYNLNLIKMSHYFIEKRVQLVILCWCWCWYFLCFLCVCLEKVSDATSFLFVVYHVRPYMWYHLSLVRKYNASIFSVLDKFHSTLYFSPNPIYFCQTKVHYPLLISRCCCWCLCVCRYTKTYLAFSLCDVCVCWSICCK